jgi:hypothetical protein
VTLAECDLCCLLSRLDQETLRVWAELGARDPEQLKQLLVKRSMQPLTALAIQSVLDVVACAGQPCMLQLK